MSAFLRQYFIPFFGRPTSSLPERSLVAGRMTSLPEMGHSPPRMADVSHPYIFDRLTVRRHRDRAAAMDASHEALFDELSALLIERVGDVKRSFTSMLTLGARRGALADTLTGLYGAHVIAADLSEPMIRQGVRQKTSPVLRVVADDELLPFAANSFDLIVSHAHLHWCNDLPGALAQIKASLRTDGVFFATLIGGQSLIELRSCLLDAELAITGGVSPRVSPNIDLMTASGLLQRAGFALPVTDNETLTLVYPDALALMRDLRGMGETNAHRQRSKASSSKRVLFEAARLYHERHANDDGHVTATIDVLFLHGWKS